MYNEHLDNNMDNLSLFFMQKGSCQTELLKLLHGILFFSRPM